MRYVLITFALITLGVHVARAETNERELLLNVSHDGAINVICNGKPVSITEEMPVSIGGQQASLKRFSQNYYEANAKDLTVSIAVEESGYMAISWIDKNHTYGQCIESAMF